MAVMITETEYYQLKQAARHAQGWFLAEEAKPQADEDVIVFRICRVSGMRITGFRSYAVWNGKVWVDRVDGRIVDDVKFWHKLPGIPAGEIGE